MIGWLWRVFVGRFMYCHHKWETIDTIECWSAVDSKYPSAHIYVLRCESCGEIEKRRV